MLNKLFNLDDKYKVYLLCIIILTVLLRFYFFVDTNTQAHWWDSLGYGSIAKEMLLGKWSDNAFLQSEMLIRPPLLPILWSSLLTMGLTDLGIILLLEIIPSIISVWIIFLIGKELYDKRIGIIASFVLAISWMHIFYSLRIMTDTLALFFSLLSIYFFVKSYKEINTKLFALSMLFLSFAFLTRFFYIIFGLVYIIFLIFVHKYRFVFKKGFWLGGIAGSIPLIIFLLNNFLNSGSIMPAESIYSASAVDKPIAFYIIDFFPHILGNLLTIIFLLGVVVMGVVFTNKKLEDTKSDILMIISFLIPFVFFMFLLKAAEDRYFFLFFVPLLVIISKGLLFVYEYVKKYNKSAALIVVLILLLLSIQAQISYGGAIIENKKTSYIQMKDAFLWIKKNTPIDSMLLGDGIDLYAIYYSERGLLDNTLPLDDIAPKSNYIILHSFEYQSQKLIDYVNSGVLNLTIAKAFFFDPEQQNPAVIIYEINGET